MIPPTQRHTQDRGRETASALESERELKRAGEHGRRMERMVLMMSVPTMTAEIME